MAVSSGALALLLAFAGLLGLVIGSFLNVVVYRVPAGIPLTRESRCPRCDAPVRWWQNVPVFGWLALRGRCAHCGEGISARYPLVEAATCAAFVLVTWLWATVTAASQPWTWVALVAYLYFAAVAIALTLIDLDTRRLPDAIVLPSYLVAAGLFTVACLLGAPWDALLRAGIGMAGLYAFYFALRFVRPAGMGGGDVKLAGVVGLFLGWLSWDALLVGAVAAFALGGAFGILLIATRRAGRESATPFGPWMIAGAIAGLLVGNIVGTWYVGMLTMAA